MSAYDDLYTRDIKKLRTFNQVERSAFELYKYYEFNNEENGRDDLNQVFKSSFEVISFSKEEKKKFLK
ncbi:MAG: hypothetical protein Q4G04_06500 [bacterium]|nr:hypothetical protein [bacterium]